MPLWSALSDAAAAFDWLVADHHGGSAVGADVLESLVPAVASVQAEEEAATGIGEDTVSRFDGQGVDEVAAVTARKSHDRPSFQSGLVQTE